MTDKEKHVDDFFPPDHIPDEDLPPDSLARRVAAGRFYKPHPTHDYNSKTGALTPRVVKTEAPKKRSFFDNKED